MDTFICEDCGELFNSLQLRHRETERGEYCQECAKKEECDACGELDETTRLIYIGTNQHWICKGCLDEFIQTGF